MSITPQDLEARFENKRSDALIKIAYLMPEDYEPMAVEIARKILTQRGISEGSKETLESRNDLVDLKLENVEEKKHKYNIWGGYEGGKYKPGWAWTYLGVSIYISLWSTDEGIYVLPAMILHLLIYKLLEKVNSKKAKQLYEEELALKQKKEALREWNGDGE